MIKKLWVMLLAAACASSAMAAERKFLTKESKDDISGESVYGIGLLAEDGKSILLIKAFAGQTPLISITPAKTIFPDETDLASRKMSVGVTLRSTAKDAPIAKTWTMKWMNYESAVASFSPDEVKEILGGDAVTIQLDKVGQRYRFATSGEGFEDLPAELEKLLKLAPTPEQDRARVDELLKKHGISGDGKQDAAQRLPAGTDSESKEVAKARREGREVGESMAVASAGVAGFDEHMWRGRAKTTASNYGYKKPSDPRRKAFVEGYMERMKEMKKGK